MTKEQKYSRLIELTKKCETKSQFERILNITEAYRKLYKDNTLHMNSWYQIFELMPLEGGVLA